MPARCWIAPRDADGDVQLRRDDLAGLADLPVVRRVARVDRGAAGAQGGAQLVGQRRQHLVELLARAQRAAAGDDDLGRGQFGPVALGDLAADEAATCRCRPRRLTVSTAADAAGGRLPASKPVVRTVMTLIASLLCTVAIALPA